MRKRYKDGPSRFARTHFNRSISLTHRLVGGGGGEIGLHVHLSAKQNRPRSPRESHYTCTTRAGGRERAEASANNFTDSSGEPLNYSAESLLRKRRQNKIPQQHTHTHTKEDQAHLGFQRGRHGLALVEDVLDLAQAPLARYRVRLQLRVRFLGSLQLYFQGVRPGVAGPSFRFLWGGGEGRGGAAALSVGVRSLCGRCT